jgi:hypothetical protein
MYMSLSFPQPMKDMYLEVVLLIAHACLTRVSHIPARENFGGPERGSRFINQG